MRRPRVELGHLQPHHVALQVRLDDHASVALLGNLAQGLQIEEKVNRLFVRAKALLHGEARLGFHEAHRD